MFVLFFHQIVFSIFCEVSNIYQVAVLYFICIIFQYILLTERRRIDSQTLINDYF